MEDMCKTCFNMKSWKRMSQCQNMRTRIYLMFAVADCMLQYKVHVLSYSYICMRIGPRTRGRTQLNICNHVQQHVLHVQTPRSKFDKNSI